MPTNLVDPGFSGRDDRDDRAGGADRDDRADGEVRSPGLSHRLAHVREAVAALRIAAGRLGDSIRAVSARPLTRGEKIALALVVLVPCVFNAIALLPELTIPVPSLNDDAYHYLFIQRASEALANGENVFDHWLPQVETGVAQFFYYQHLPALAVVGLQRVSFGALDLLTAFNLIRYVLMVVVPLTVFVSMRAMGFSGVAAAIGAVASTLLSGNFRYGFEYDSYVWRGLGMYTQLWAMNLSFLTIAATYRALQRGKGLWLAGLVFGLLVLTHLIYAYMTAMAVVVIALWGINRANLSRRVVRLMIVGACAAVISSYMWLPFLTQAAYLNATPYLQPEKYDSYGAGPILTWLFTGDLLDCGRLPVLSVLLLLGVASAILGRSRVALVSLGLFVMWLVAYFGRPTLGVIADLFPLHNGLLFHRFLGAVDLAAILLIGCGGAIAWGLFRPHRGRWRLAAAFVLLVALFTPALVERNDFYALNTAWEQRSLDAVQSDTDAQAILANLKTLPPGRVFVGLPTSFANKMAFQDLHFYNLLAFDAIEGLAPPNESMSLNSDYIWDFNDQDPASFDLYNVRYMVAPSDLAVGSFLTPIQTTARYTLYQAPTTGYAEYVGIASRRAVASQAALFAVNRTWERTGNLPAEHSFIRYDYPALVAGTDPWESQPCPGGGRTDFEAFKPGRIDLVVDCPVASTLIIKTTYHPNWQVLVDGSPVPVFMVSPSYLGISLAGGRHSISATYVPTSIKTPLIVLGSIVILLLLLFGRRLDPLAERVAGRLAIRRMRKGSNGDPSVTGAPETLNAGDPP